MKYKVYDEFNGSLETAWEIEAFDAEDAAILYAQDDHDGHIDGIYLSENCREIQNLERDGQPIVTVSSNGFVEKFKVGIVEFSPVYGACKVEK